MPTYQVRPTIAYVRHEPFEVEADTVDVTPCGALVFTTQSPTRPSMMWTLSKPTLILAPTMWASVHLLEHPA
jgi:hypothetical protein